MAGFIFGGSTGESQQSLARKRQVAEALMSNMGRTPRDIGEGLNAVGQALLARSLMNKVEGGEMAGRQGAIGKVASIAAALGGTFPAAPGAPASVDRAPLPAIAAPAPQSDPNLPSSMDFARAQQGDFDVRGGLIERGLPEHVADAFVMNFQDESGLNPGINEANPIIPGSRGGFGLSQWTGPRRKGLEAYAAQRGVGVDDPNMQLDYLMTELQGPEADAFDKIMAAPDTGSAAAAIVNNFLRPAESHRAAREARYLGGGTQVAQAPGIAKVAGVMSDADPYRSETLGARPIPTGGPDLQMLMEAASDPYLNDQERGMVNVLLERQMQLSDPMRALQMEKLRREIASPQKRDTTTINGRLVDAQTGQEIASYPDPMKPTTGQQDYEYYRDFEVKNGRQPLGPLEWEQAQRKAGATSVNVGAEGGDFYKELDKKSAETFAGLSEAGVQSRSKLAQIDRLEGLLNEAGTGGMARLKQVAGEYGIKTEGLDDIQAAQALINELVPQQRLPGSGPMSDADLALFKQSLPRLINQPGGNQMIVNTMRGITQYQMNLGEIADAVADRTMTPAEARKAIRELQNPLDGFKDALGKKSDAPVPAEGKKRLKFNPDTGRLE